MTASDRCLKTRGGRKMAEYQLKNQELTLKISSKGAKMKSLKDNKTNQEYLWHGDSAYWGRTSPVLFPIVGNYREKESVFEGKTYSMSQHGFAREVLDYNPENKIAEVLSPNGKNTINVPDIEPDMIHFFSVGEYKNTGKIKREINEPDPFAPIIPDQTKDKVWQKMSTRGKYRLTKDLAERMGLDNVIVYEHESDLPVSVRSLKKQGGKIGGYYMHNGNIGIVLDNIPSYTRLQRVLLHEAIGHQGLDALFGDSYFKDEFLMKVYRSMPSEWKLRGNSWNARKTDAEEYLADLASNGVSSSAWNQIYGELRNMLRIFIPGLNFSEREIRNILIRSKNALN